jgi:zinc and cadmium transporter
MGMLIGLSLHTLLDGMALAASLHAESGHRVFLSLYGLGTFLAILLHKPLDAISITSLMRAGGWSSKARLRVNLGFSLMCPVGAVLFSLGLTSLGPQQQLFIDAALAFSAGIFLCISLSDLLPEMEFHAHNRLQLTAALLAGILLAYGIRFLEPSWMH